MKWISGIAKNLWMEKPFSIMLCLWISYFVSLQMHKVLIPYFIALSVTLSTRSLEGHCWYAWFDFNFNMDLPPWVS
jgi:hypothetical protein